MQKAHDQYIEGRRLPPSSFDQHALLLAGMRGGTKNLTLKSRELVQCTEFKMLHVQIKKCLIKKGAFKIETSRTQSQNHITRPNVLLWLICFIEYLSDLNNTYFTNYLIGPVRWSETWMKLAEKHCSG